MATKKLEPINTERKKSYSKRSTPPPSTPAVSQRAFRSLGCGVRMSRTLTRFLIEFTAFPILYFNFVPWILSWLVD